MLLFVSAELQGDEVRLRIQSAEPLEAAAEKLQAERTAAQADRDRLQQDLAGKGLVFNQPTTAPFRDKLKSAGFYAEWKGKYGEQAWDLLEKAVGKLS